MVAPFSRADIALSTVRRESSTRQSEYTKPERKSGFRPALYSMCGKLTAFEPGSVMRPPRWSYIHRPMRIIHTGRRCLSWGSTKRSGRMMCGREAQQHLALLQRLAHQAELVLLEVAQARRG